MSSIVSFPNATERQHKVTVIVEHKKREGHFSQVQGRCIFRFGAGQSIIKRLHQSQVRIVETNFRNNYLASSPKYSRTRDRLPHTWIILEVLVLMAEQNEESH